MREDDVGINDVFGVLPYVVVTFRRSGVIVEQDTRRNDVDKCKTFVHDRRFDQRYQLSLVSRKTSGNETRTDL